MQHRVEGIARREKYARYLRKRAHFQLLTERWRRIGERRSVAIVSGFVVGVHDELCTRVMLTPYYLQRVIVFSMRSVDKKSVVCFD
ncbi:MAG: hypothetical protein ACOX36_01010 [Saccharofermentanales bacterium]